MKYWSRLASLLLLTLGGASQAAPNLWHARSADNELFILGSIHLGKSSLYPLPEVFESTLESSDRLVLETDLNAITLEDRQLITQLSAQPEGHVLSDDLSVELTELLSLQSTNLGVSMTSFEGMQPWYVALNLTQLKMAQLGYEASLGIDQHFLQLAQELNVPIASLESVSEQFSALAVLRHNQVTLLEQTLEQLPSLDTEFKKIIQLWDSGDEQQLFDLLMSDAMFEGEESRALEHLLYERNHAWIEHLIHYPGRSFVVVGAMHLQSEQGLLALLEQQGYQIEVYQGN